MGVIKRQPLALDVKLCLLAVVGRNNEGGDDADSADEQVSGTLASGEDTKIYCHTVKCCAVSRGYTGNSSRT